MSALAIAEAAPLSFAQSDQLTQLFDALDRDGLLWASGFAAGLAHARGDAVPAASASPVESVGQRLTVLYGSQTGNAQRIAQKLAARAEAAGVPVRLLRADAYPLRELKDERLLYVVISTQGDGDPPEDARGFVEYLQGRKAPALDQLAFAVLGLGDSSYPQFCAVGRLLDQRLAALGATRLFACAEADLDIDAVAAPWLDLAQAKAEERLLQELHRATVTPLRRAPQPAAPDASREQASREQPAVAELLVNQRISGRDSARDVRHIELSLTGSGLNYQPGDALGVWPQNDAALVAQLLAALHLDGNSVVTHGEHSLPLRQWLAEHRELTRLSRGLIAAHATRAGAAGLNALLADADATRAWLVEHQVLDLIQRWPAVWSAQELVAALPALTPRLYSIASSQAEVGDEAHLTVALVQDRRDGEDRFGAASHYLAQQPEGARLRVFIKANERFRLPTDPDRDAIMIGPGTGVAPFRAFVQQRAAGGGRGRNWLLFGARHFHDDFYYQLEWQQALKDGRLDRLDLAFSRDGGERRVYVQQRLAEQGKAVVDWLQNGAHLYVCGAVAMGKDVHRALQAVLVAHAGYSAEQAEAYLRELQQCGRYARDVY
ncbi:MAG: assimilatory sulfite reductase (NADPH) flavoprotein subunit [Gammaproteobacteria bacterium HGW-Gammaproteobacteria-4]|jgi:sulfite reductase (NADPH) flavoprotein alpha-component|nr:MAG: assimilatory sulfite reductase (NADPH) flavoprotein subunit [Gammaproteobacteria bacterium HGW-Gammaproteobacteria-4]